MLLIVAELIQCVKVIYFDNHLRYYLLIRLYIKII